MRKVFLSTMLLRKQEANGGYISDDFELSAHNYRFPLTYIIENEVEDGDEVLVATVIQANDQEKNMSHENCEEYKNDIRKALAGRNVKLEFQDIETTKHFESYTFNSFFMRIADLIQENDQLYMDITFGMKPYSFSMFIAASYAVKANENVELASVIYAQKYTGSVKSQEHDPAKIYDLTGLFLLNEIAGDAKAGQREQLDMMFKCIMSD